MMTCRWLGEDDCSSWWESLSPQEVELVTEVAALIDLIAGGVTVEGRPQVAALCVRWIT